MIPVIVLIVLLVNPELNFFLVGLAYVISGPAGMLWRWRTGRELLPADPEEGHGAGESVVRPPVADEAEGSVWEEFEAEPSSEEREAGAHGTPKVTSIADHWPVGGSRGGEGGR